MATPSKLSQFIFWLCGAPLKQSKDRQTQQAYARGSSESELTASSQHLSVSTISASMAGEPPKVRLDGSDSGEADGENSTASSVLLSLVQFADSTTAHGFSRLVGTSNRLGNGLWLLFLMTAYAVLGYHTSTLVGKYKTHPVTTSLITDLPYEYPDIYLCSANPVGYSRITKPLQHTADYAMQYDLNVTAYALRLQREVMNNTAAQVAQQINDAWMNWGTTIMSSRVNLSLCERLLNWVCLDELGDHNHVQQGQLVPM